MRGVVREEIALGLSALRTAGWAIPEEPEIPLDQPRRPEHGDLASNVAMALGKPTGRKPREIAEALAQALRARIDRGEGHLSAVEVAGPGFLNLRVKPSAWYVVIQRVLAEGDRYGTRAPRPDGGRTQVEFVSANPTGPLHVGHGRGAVVGDVLVRLLQAAGYAVEREYYINDAGAQVRLLARSVRARHRGEPTPEGGYGGEYITTLAQALAASAPALLDGDEDALAKACVDRMMDLIRATLARLDIRFGIFFSERSLTEQGKLDGVLRELDARGFLEERDGALFFKVRDAGGEDADRVLRKSNGDLTYFATDLAYHKDKLDRGFTQLIDLWGADHHGYVPRMRAGLEALGLPRGSFEALLMQMVRLLKDGQEFKMSKRAGNFVTVDELLDEIDEAARHPGAGRDAMRWFFLSRSHDSPVDFDVDLAKKQSVDNPVFYAQMSHARMCSVLERVRTSEEMAPARAAGVLSVPEGYDPALAARLVLPEERDLLARCDQYPDLVRESAAGRAPHRIVFYVQELAQAFASYFTRMQKVHDEPILPQKSFREAHADWVQRWDWEKTRARLLWLCTVRQVYANALALLGIEAPERMERTALVETVE